MGKDTGWTFSNLYQKRNCGCMVASAAVILLYIIHISEAHEDTKPAASNGNSDTYVPQVRYRTRPVAAFRSTKSSNSSSNSSETDGPESSGVPFIAVHELTSQTFDKLHENWRNLESIIRNLQNRQPPKDDSLISSSNGQPGARENVRRPPFRNDNVFIKYHPVVVDSDGSSSSNDARGAPTRTISGNYNFSPFPYDVRGQGSKNVDMERHTVATIYTIGICLAIMAIGSVMFILINKCDGTGGNNYVRTAAPANAANNNGNRITRGVIGAATRAGRQISNGRSRTTSRPSRNNENNNNGNASNSVVAIPVSGVAECDAKVLSDLPPSYDSLFPEGGPPKPQEVPPQASTTAEGSNENIQIQITSCPSPLES